MYIQWMTIFRGSLARMFEPVVRKIIQEYFQRAADKVRESGIHAAQGMIHGDTILNGLPTAMRNLYAVAAQKAIKKPIVNTKALPNWLQRVLKYLDKFLLNKVVLPISQTTIQQVDALLEQGLNNGWGTSEMVKRLEDSELPKWRARMIVRTEAVRAINAAQMMQASMNPYETEKQWIAVEDSRTRHSHHKVDGERIGLYELYSNGLMFPGDPNGPAKEVINCRCTQGFFAKQDLEGNLVPKQQRSEADIAKLLY